MRALAVLALLIGLSRVAHAQPVRVTIECENTGRTKACPAFLLGFLDAHKVFLQSPRSSADVIVYANANEVALVDRIHLRFVGHIAGAPATIEVDVDVDSRADDDTQRKQLEPAFLRGMALYVGMRFPKLVAIEISEPAADEAKAKSLSPWDFSLEIGGFASKSGDYENYNGYSSLTVARVKTRTRQQLAVYGNGGINRQPPLTLDDGTKISTNTNNYVYSAQLEGAWLYNHCYSIGGSTSTWREDPKGQFRYGYDAKLGVEWDHYRADDPRGNRLSVAYIATYALEAYHLRNELGETSARVPSHALVATGTLRKDKVKLGLELQVSSMINHPKRRHAISASPSIEVQIGDHIDVGLSFSITKREQPGPDESLIDPTDYAQLSRLSYAEPLQMNGSFSVRLHWDRTNGQRNDRLDML